jgi:hypothetical protein
MSFAIRRPHSAGPRRPFVAVGHEMHFYALKRFAVQGDRPFDRGDLLPWALTSYRHEQEAGQQATQDMSDSTSHLISSAK